MTPVAGPELSISTANYNVKTNQSIPIRLELEKNTQLQVLTILNGELKGEEEFSINRRRFVYMLTPEPGENLLRFKLTDEQGRTTVKDVVVVFTPETGIPDSESVARQIQADSNRYKGLTEMAGGNIARLLQQTDLNNSKFSSVADIYDFLLENSDEYGYTPEEINELMSEFLSQKDLSLFFREISDLASDSLRNQLREVDFISSNIYTSESLTGYLHTLIPETSYNYEALRNALYQIAAVNRDPKTLVELLESYSQGELKDYLNLMNQNIELYRSTGDVADSLLNAAMNNVFQVKDLEDVIDRAAAELDMYFISQGLEFMSTENLRKTIADLDLREKQIKNAPGLIAYLLNEPNTSYTKREVLENIEKIRKDPYYYVDLLRRMLAGKATGSLKLFLEEINVRDLQLNTFEELIDYLMNQSKFHDYNREMVYQLLIDIINPANVEEFVNLLLQYGEDPIINALNSADIKQFSVPVEVLQYLLSVGDEYHFTERDLLRVLLKILLRKGPAVNEVEHEKGWLSGLDKPALITSLIIINGLILVFLIIFILRKKRKNE